MTPEEIAASLAQSDEYIFRTLGLDGQMDTYCNRKKLGEMIADALRAARIEGAREFRERAVGFLHLEGYEDAANAVESLPLTPDPVTETKEK